jgi:acyl carrier protein
VHRDGATGGGCTAIPAANQGGGSVEAVTDEVRRIIARELKIPLERLTPDTVLQDLGGESLDLIEIIFALEEKFDTSIPYNANDAAATDKRESSMAGLGKLETIDQICTAAKGLVDAKTSA